MCVVKRNFNVCGNENGGKHTYICLLPFTNFNSLLTVDVRTVNLVSLQLNCMHTQLDPQDGLLTNSR